MRIGTKSVLFGAHCFFVHPWFVALGWWCVYGFPWDPRLWVAFFVHDIGYLGKPNMDGPEGEHHPELGAKIMSYLFDRWRKPWIGYVVLNTPGNDHRPWIGKWGQFSLFHSRYYANLYDMPFSKLCVADKYAIVLTPKWLFTILATLTGEIEEYRSKKRDYADGDQTEWDYAHVQTFCAEWVAAHKDKSRDEWIGTGRLTDIVNKKES